MRRAILAALCAASLVASIAQAGAYFTARTSIADNVITVGTVSISAEPTASALSVPVLGPGQTVVRAVTVSNGGSLDADVILTAAKKAGYTDVYESLTCRVLRGTDVLYEGSMSGLRTTPTRVDAGGEVEMRFELGLPPTADDGLQGDYVRLTLYADAEQVHP